MNRLLAVGLLLVAISPSRQVAAQSAVAPLMEEPLVQGLHVRVFSRSDRISVDVATDRRQSSQALQSFAVANVQVWVLKSDGAALPRIPPGGDPVRVSAMSNGQVRSVRIGFGFEPAERQDLAAVVVSVDGVLFVRRIPQTPAN